MFRKITSDITIMIMMNVKLQGVVEIDEAVITGKRKYHRGRLMTRLYWLFGMYSRNSKTGYAFLVKDRKSETLMPIISQ